MQVLAAFEVVYAKYAAKSLVDALFNEHGII